MWTLFVIALLLHVAHHELKYHLLFLHIHYLSSVLLYVVYQASKAGIFSIMLVLCYILLVFESYYSSVLLTLSCSTWIVFIEILWFDLGIRD